MLTVQHEAAEVTKMIWRRVAMIVLHGAVRITCRTLTKVVDETVKVT